MYKRKDEGSGPLPEGTLSLTNTLLLTIPEAATHLRVSRRQVDRMISQDQIPVIRIGRLVRVAYEDLRAFVKRERRFESYYITPETLRLTRRKTDDKRLAEEFEWD